VADTKLGGSESFSAGELGFRRFREISMYIFLKLKSWQLFLLLLGIPGIAHLLLNPLMPGDNTNFLLLSPFEIILLLLLLSWFGVLGIWLNQFVSEDLRSATNFFKFSIIFPVAIIISLEVLFIFRPSNSSLLNFVFPLYFLYIFCLLYDLNFISKNLVLAEKNDKVKIEEYIGPFFALWFFPIGLWFIQPRVNALFAQKTA
jgi:hypothetical protein